MTCSGWVSDLLQAMLPPWAPSTGPSARPVARGAEDIVSCGRAALAKAVKGEPALRAVEVAAEEVIRWGGGR